MSGRRVFLWCVATALAIGAVLAILVWAPPLLIPDGSLDQGDRIRLLSESSIRSTVLQIAGAIVLVLGIIYTAGQVRISRETHYTERYSKAVDQLGSEEAIVRVGAMFALRRLAENSAVDGPVVVEVLRSYLRLKSARPRRATPQSAQIPPDVQVAIDVLLELNASAA